MLHEAITVGVSAINGRGLFAAASIPVGALIWRETKVTPTFSRAEIESWDLQQQARFLEHAYQVGADRWMGYLDFNDDIEMLMNHSCDPNTWFEGDWQMVARRAIAAGEEITYDYSTSDTEFLGLKCRCGSGLCRGVITGAEYQDLDFQRRYANHFLSYVGELISRIDR